LLLGETGVGKSTLINSIANYMMYETFQEAIDANQPKVIVDSRYSLQWKTNYHELRTFEIMRRGINSPDVELAEPGKSATTKPCVYSFSCGDVQFNFIDTPSIGHTKGIQQDIIN